MRSIPAAVWFGIACEAEREFGHRRTWTETPEKRDAVARWMQRRVRELSNGAEPPKPAPAPVRMWNEPAEVTYEPVGRWDDCEGL